jgi:hypothetical protein
MGFAQHGQIDTKALIGCLAARDRLEHKVERGLAVDDLDRIGHMCEHAGLGRYGIALPQLIEHFHQIDGVGNIVRRRIDPDGRISRPQKQTVKRACRHAAQVVCRMVRLKPGRQAPGQAHGGPEGRRDPHLAGHGDKILIAHEL